MDLSLDKLRELLENFLSDTGGRRGRKREQQRDSGRSDAGGAGAEGDLSDGDFEGMDDLGLDDDFVMGGGDGGSGGGMDDLGLDDDFVMGGGGGGRPDSSDLGDDGVVDDLYYRIESLEDELDKNSSELGAIQDSQQHVSEQVEDVNDTVRRLLGVYDQLTDEVNPFTGEGETESGFGVFGDQSDEFATTAVGGVSDEENPPIGEGVTFSDLKNALEDGPAEEGEEITFEEDLEDEDDTRVEVQATESVDEPDEEDGDSDVTLDTLAETFATDILVFEWLTYLVRTGGPAATLRAISYYYEIGWIEEDVKDQLEAVLSGPDLDIHVDPEATPSELSAEDHADSYTYIMKLNEIHETKQEVEP